MLDFSRTRETPYDIQRVGIEALVKYDDFGTGRVLGGCFGLFDAMGVGKSKQTIDAAQFLFEQKAIDRVIVVAPSSVRAVWFDEELGELQKHAWLDIGHGITEFHGRNRSWKLGAGKQLEWLITNYEFIRSKPRLAQLKAWAGPRTLLILDESSAVKTHSAQQTRACLELRRACGRVWLLNGTPISNNPGDMFAQGQIMDPKILDCKTWWQFRARYALMGGWQNKQIVGWRMLDDLQRRFKPYVLRRLTEDSLDLPKKNAPVQISAVLTERSWKLYKEMREEMVAWLDQQTMSVASQAGVKAMRLAQITSGFLGGIDALPVGLALDADEDEFELPLNESTVSNGVAVVGREKLDVILQWIYERMDANAWDHKILMWSRFRPEVFRLLSELALKFPAASLGAIIGGQKKVERRDALRLLDPRTTPRGPVIVVGTPASGSMGLNCTASYTMPYMSNDFNLKTRLQSMARIHRGGQVHDCDYFDVVAVGPNGQKTIDHHVLKALNNKENLAAWTADAWRAALLEE